MNKANAVLMLESRDLLKGNWGLPIAVTALCIVLGAGMQVLPVVGWIASIVIQPQIGVGASIFYLNFSREKEVNIEQLFITFKDINRVGNIIGTYLLMLICIILGFICFIIPGIILCFAFSQVFFILAENERISPLDALKKSYNLMNGNKWVCFCLMCRFIGWLIISILTFGIGFFWLYPYYWVSMAKFYDNISLDYIQSS
tara:strand:+ start:209 stop:811 length:603 start_codon:yes stop_codon:yes gene_type:complete